jgi:dihydroflavonol-4-reductase
MDLITGAAGHVGNTLVRELLARGQQVRVLVVPGEDVRSLAGLAVQRVEGNVLDPQSLQAAFTGVDKVYHLAGIVSILPGRDELMRQVNVLGTCNVVQAVRRAGVRRLVYASSIHALARPPRGMRIDESVPFNPHNAEGEYDRTKAEASLIIQEECARGLDAVIVCPTGVLGPYDFRGSEMGRLLRSWLTPGVHFLVNGRFDFVDVRDVARGLLLAGERGRSGETYILGGHPVSIPDLRGLVAEAAGPSGPTITLPYHLALVAASLASRRRRVGLPFPRAQMGSRGCNPRFTPYSLRTLAGNANISHAKASRELGYEPRELKPTVTDTVAWWKEHPHLLPPQARDRPAGTPVPPEPGSRLAVITGASSGIGAATARLLADAGYAVLLVARRLDRLQELAAEIRAAGGNAQALAVDLVRPDGPRSVYEHVMQRYGGLEVLVNSAGFGWYGWCSDMQWTTAQDMIQLNDAALAQLIVLFLPVMRRAARGHIVNLSSVAGTIPSQGVALYSATKSFVDALTRALYRELRGSGVHVSEVKPGAVLTEFYRTAEKLPKGSPVPAERFGVKAEAVARAILGLLKRPRRSAWVPGGLRMIPWVELAFGWLIDQLGPLLLHRSYG